MKKWTAILLALFIINAVKVHALEKPTHKALNEKAANISNTNKYLMDVSKLFPNGLNTSFNDKKAIEWIQGGGKAEDEPAYSRSFNHFLNPIDNTGYLGLFKSAREWALEQGTFGSLFGGDYSIF